MGGGTCSKCAQDKLRSAQGGVVGAKEYGAPQSDLPPPSSGAPLDQAARSFMEMRFGQDFSRVRVHADSNAAASAKAIDAAAYTVGRDIVFGSNRYAPATPAGRHLIAHELTHVIQQNAAIRGGPSTPFGTHSERAELEADHAASQVLRQASTPRVSVVVPAGTVQRQEASASPQSDASYFTDAPIQKESDCVVPFNGKSLDSILDGGAITVVEFGATWCGPCKVISRFMQQECSKHKNDRKPMRFYSVDVDQNQELAAQYAKSSVPHLYVFSGKTQKYHGSNQESSDFYAKLFAGIASEMEPKKTEPEGKLGQSPWLVRGLSAAGGVALAGGALGIAAGLHAHIGAGAVLGILGAGLVVGGLIGFLDPLGFTKRTRAVGASEADALIRHRFGTYLPKQEQGAQPLGDARIRPVSQAQLQTLWKCRHTGSKDTDLSHLIGWTDQGPESPKTANVPEQGPACDSKIQLESASPDKPVIYYASDQPDTTVLIHEGLHAYAHQNFSKQLRNFVNEGATEYFTQQIADEIGASSKSGYGDNVENIKRLVAVIGEEALRQAFFQGDFTAANKALGSCGLEAWSQYLQKSGDSSAAEVLSNRKGNYCADVKKF